MLRNYLRIALRSISKARLYSTLNIVGLGVGLTVFFLIISWIRFEFSFDRFHEKADRIYKVVKEDADNYFLGTNRFAVTPIALEQALLDEVPGVEAATQINKAEVLLRAGDRSVVTQGILATPSFFDVFTFPLLEGDPATALARPGSVLITPDLAGRLFGSGNPIGNRIEYEYFGSHFELEVVGIVAEPPTNSHFGFSFVLAADTDPNRATRSDQWGSSSVHTYAVLSPNTDPGDFAERISGIIDLHVRGEDWYDPERATTLIAQPLADIHLHSRANFELAANGDIGQVTWGFLLALLILLIPCTNYMNLATARAATRQREVGVRKAVGADRSQIIAQFLGESVLVALLSAVLAVVLISVFRPVFNSFVGREIPSSFLMDTPAIAVALLAVVIVGIVSGSYPAFVISRSRAAAIFRGDSVLSSHRSRLQDVLVVLQFAVGIGLIFSTLVVHRQIRFVSSADTGMDRQRVVAIRVRDPEMRERWETLTAEMRNAPGVIGLTGSSYLPTDVQQSNGTDQWEDNVEAREQSVYMANVDYGFTELLGLRIVRGRGFSKDFPTDIAHGLLINETAARAFGWDEPIGKHISFGDSEQEIVGVVGDFNFHSFRQPIAALALALDPGWLSYILLKTDGHDTRATIDALETTWSQFTTGFPFEYQFLDDAFDRHFEQDRRLADLLNAFSAIALVIACLGLFGLTAFIAQMRTKEIGVRKVLGARVWDIVLLLSRGFTVLVGIAVFVGCPIAYVLMNRWLDGFAYRILPGAGTMLITAVLAVAIGWITVAWQSIRAANMDPVRSLRYE